MNSTLVKAAEQQRLLSKIKFAVKQSLESEFPEFIATPMGIKFQADPLQPSGYKIVCSLDVQLSVKDKAPQV